MVGVEQFPTFLYWLWEHRVSMIPTERTLKMEKTPGVLPYANKPSLTSQVEPIGNIYP